MLTRMPEGLLALTVRDMPAALKTLPRGELVDDRVGSVLEVEGQDPRRVGDWLDADLTLGALVPARASRDGHRVGNVRCFS
jgi:hypothetical protein